MYLVDTTGNKKLLMPVFVVVLVFVLVLVVLVLLLLMMITMRPPTFPGPHSNYSPPQCEPNNPQILACILPPMVVCPTLPPHPYQQIPEA
jgi:hypothetical protein